MPLYDFGCEECGHTEELLLYKSKFNILKVEWANMEHNMMLNVTEQITKRHTRKGLINNNG